MGIHGFTWVYRGYRGILWFTLVYKGIIIGYVGDDMVP